MSGFYPVSASAKRCDPMKKIPKAAIVGTGWIAGLHARALCDLHIPLVAVLASTEDKAKAFASEYGISAYGTDPAVLKEADCVHICTPPAAHGALISQLLEQGKHIFCEKPLTLEPAEGEALCALAEEKGLHCAVGFNVRFYPALQKAKELVASPEFGRLILIHGSYLQEFGAEPAALSWRYRDPLHAVSEIGSHWLDLAQYVSGRSVTALSALFDRFQPERYEKDGLLYLSPTPDRRTYYVPSEDAAVLNLRFSGGAIGSVVLSELSHGHSNSMSLELTGTKQTISWNSLQPHLLSLAEKGKMQILELGGEFAETFTHEIADYYAALQQKSPLRCADFREAGCNVRLCSLAKESADRNGQWMEVEP